MFGENLIKKKIYLTFDDGPDPIATPIVLDVLKKKDIKATFFCLGENLKKHQEVAARILLEGHQIGNHTYSHENGWGVDTSAYLSSVGRCEEVIKSFHQKNHSLIFRPPYGKIKIKQMNKLTHHYKIIMWSLMSGDFDIKQSTSNCLKVLMDKSRAGDIVLFHDKASTISKLDKVLPEYLDYCHKEGLEFSLL